MTLAAIGMDNDTRLLRPISEGSINARARALHAGRTTWLWDVQFTDDADRLCATSRVTIAVTTYSPPPSSKHSPRAAVPGRHQPAPSKPDASPRTRPSRHRAQAPRQPQPRPICDRRSSAD
jgi:hypothetical protein